MTVAPTSLAALARSFDGLGLVGQFLGLLRSAARAAARCGSRRARAIFQSAKVGACAGVDTGDLEDGVAFAGGRVLRRVALLGLEGLGDELRAVRQRGDGAARRPPAAWSPLQMMRRGGLVEAVLGGLGGQLPGVVLFGLRDLLAAQRGLDGVGCTSFSGWACAGWRSSTCTM